MADNNSKCNFRYNAPDTMLPSETPLAMAYIPYQSWEEPYAENVALAAGTIFPSLNLPFTGKEVSPNE